MAEFTYKNITYISSNQTFFKFHCGYYFCVFYKKGLNFCSKSKGANELASNLKKLMTLCQKNRFYAQELQKQADDKSVKPKNYTFSNKIWLNN